MVARMFAAIVGGISFGLALGLGIAGAAAETRVVDGVSQYVVQYEVGTPGFSEGTIPAGFVAHRVVKQLGGTQLVESQAADLGWRLGALYAIGGAIVGGALVCGADPRRVLAAGLMSALFIWLVSFPIINSPAEELPALAIIVLVVLGIVSCEAIRSATFKKPTPEAKQSFADVRSQTEFGNE
jgi:hypothetical protein